MERIYLQDQCVEHGQKHRAELLGTAASQVAQCDSDLVFHRKGSYICTCFFH